MSRYVRVADTIDTAVDDELFVVLPGGAQVFHLDAMAAALWRALAEPASSGELTALFQAAFPGVTETQLATDIASALARLEGDGLLVAARG